jgi:hypothetical protein
VIDYAKLAEKAKAKQDAGKRAVERQSGQRSDPNLFFERVKAHIVEEMDKANAELRKKGAETIVRNYLPSYGGEICLTYGTYLLCCVEFEAHAEGSLIKAVISGPPTDTRSREWNTLSTRMPRSWRDTKARKGFR